MKGIPKKDSRQKLDLEYDLDAAPEKVWRAVSIPAIRERWLPVGGMVQAEPVDEPSGEELRFKIKDSEPPFLESIVTFQITPTDAGGTRLRIIQELAGMPGKQRLCAATNFNRPVLLRAA